MKTPIMEQVRQHLIAGKSSDEIIAMGFRPSTVYKVQQYVRADPMTADLQDSTAKIAEELSGQNVVEVSPVAPSNGPSEDQAQKIADLEAERDVLAERVDELEQDAADSESLRHEVEELTRALGRETESRQNWADLAAQWQHRTKLAESEAAEIRRQWDAAKRDVTVLRRLLLKKEQELLEANQELKQLHDAIDGNVIIKMP